MTDKARELKKAIEFIEDLKVENTKLAALLDCYMKAANRPFVRLSEEEVTEILTSAYDMYAAICAVENRLVEKNRG